MEKERKVKYLSLAALIVAVLGLTVAFAAMSEILTINGNASIDAASWDIHFANLSDPIITGDATATKPALTGTTISGFDVTVTKPGDSVIYEFDIVNNGTIDAYIGEYVEAQSRIVQCSKMGDLAEDCLNYDFSGDGSIDFSDINEWTRMITYGLYYTDTGEKVKYNDDLMAGETKRVKLVVEYRETANRLPDTSLSIFGSDQKYEITYEQD